MSGWLLLELLGIGLLFISCHVLLIAWTRGSANVWAHSIFAVLNTAFAVFVLVFLAAVTSGQF